MCMNGIIDFEKAYARIAADLEAKGKPSYWIHEVVNRETPHAIFLNLGKPFYKSKCPLFEGYWLHGGCGSVQCKASKDLFPGLHLELTCRDNHEVCPYYKAAQVAEKEEKTA